MTHEVIRHLLDDYASGDLTDDARAPVAEHIAACEMCRAEVDGLKRVIDRAATLPRSIDPPAKAWSNIRDAILEDERAAKRSDPRSAGRSWRSPIVLAAAGALIVAVLSSAGTAWYLRSRASSSQLTERATTDNSAPATLAAFTAEENNYLRQASILRDILDQQEGSLAPETVAQLKASLRTIDEAILEARNALARDPANKLLVEMLSASYRQKVDLLRRSTEIARGS
jgi:anti-sigma-K factor RskA